MNLFQTLLLILMGVLLIVFLAWDILRLFRKIDDARRNDAKR